MKIAMLGAVTATNAPCGLLARETSQKAQFDRQRKIRRPGSRIKSVIRREETILRLGGNGDNYHMSWAKDDRQYTSVCDGAGWNDNSMPFNSRMWMISGEPSDARFENVAGYPYLTGLATEPSSPRYYAFGTLAIDEHIYQFLSTNSGPREGIPTNEWFSGIKLIYSPDQGRTWCNSDGSTPVVWEPWGQRSRDNMTFFGESQGAFSVISVLQMGKNYESNRDGYVYLYAQNGNVDGTANELVLVRTPKLKVLDRREYEFFEGLQANGEARWTKDILARRVVHTFPRGWVGSHPHSWIPSVVYNETLGVFLMASWGARWGRGQQANGEFSPHPSYLGFWTAPHPWGPFEQVHEEVSWAPGGDLNARAYEPQIAPKWIAPDGKSFWLVWTDFQSTNSKELWSLFDEVLTSPNPDRKRVEGWMTRQKKMQPYYAFNVQRVDLVTE
ncbi:hypothetical protein ACFPN2_28135 [Steroidobacter flavus]|uniref:DUF4185 domain-containing protein n=1 Tax=Steroidobacter flavus TaxID=1842136 RepID=A0ABV8T0T8_9GAMM